MTTRRARVPRRVPTLPEPGTRQGVVLGDRYELGPLLGVGGVARVVRARDLLLHRDVAIKLFGPGIDPSAPERERAEMRTLASLSHPNLVPLHDAGTDHDHVPPRAYLVMALVDGCSLAEQLRSGPLPELEVREMGAQVADALACVHNSGVVHRDVKPANILIDRSGRPFLTDFGIARAVGAAALTAVGHTVGTAAYLSPEQVRGEEVGPEADVYALGLVLLEALTGVREYDGSSAEMAIARLSRQPRIVESVPDDLGALLRDMTAADAAYRPTAEQVVSRLRPHRDVDATTVLRTVAPATGVPLVDATRLLPTAVPTGASARPRAGDALARAQVLGRDAWTQARPWVSERRALVAASLAALAVLIIVLVTVASQGSPGSAGVTPNPPSGTPGPARLGPDLVRLQELVQP